MWHRSAEAGVAAENRRRIAVSAFAHSERQARYDLADVTTTAKKTPDGWRLDGHKTAVLDGNVVGQIIVSARVDDGSGKPGKLCLFLAPQGRPASPCATFRGLVVGGPAISNSGMYCFLPTRCSASTDALPAIEAVVDRAIAALAAEAVGCMQVLLDTTIAYTKQRIQFGKPLADNQVLRHRMATWPCSSRRRARARSTPMLMADADPVARAAPRQPPR